MTPSEALSLEPRPAFSPLRTAGNTAAVAGSPSGTP